MPTLYSPDGRATETDNPTTIVNLKARGYREERPFVPAEHTVTEVLGHVEEHPEDAPAVVTAERAGKSRKSIVGE
jgi:hypothetical protein